ncbi:energy transducer TonB [Alteromonas macleodii]|jgi:protein TonB|uniref:energy transducer TonB n=1 Tax=Alteromonas TaxID=226 RepID=UPI0001AEBC0B|nr:energy transducer TonB [Alteromonas macleodii]AFS38982.1 hypothetical protein MASE_17460 [Alteromonas macleodii ATCC 27126]MEC8748057.1 energy transducer TonB [Pseudomonadota bacterium]RZP35730.1 MAG: hypothetical protein EVA22_05225 [Alteromonas sp.]HAD90682.1 hypothetical protein [Alteromonas macleodii]|tara:strand:- start:1647 stop:2267 length:621 start_codon:yes stop_codon:yes gene_type:complete
MKYNLQPSLLSGAVLVSALGVMWLGHFLSNLQPDTMVVRKLDIAVTPPPPPPPKTQNVVEETELVMQVEGSGAAMTMADLSVEPDIQVPKPDMPNVKVIQTQWDMPDIELDAFGLSELDSKPTLLTPVKIRFPKRLKKQGIKRVIVKLDVIIDEHGNVKLMDIVENPHHELNKEIMRFVKASKFTSPYKEDEAVKARFIWPVVIEA